MSNKRWDNFDNKCVSELNGKSFTRLSVVIEWRVADEINGSRRLWSKVRRFASATINSPLSQCDEVPPDFMWASIATHAHSRYHSDVNADVRKDNAMHDDA